MQNNNQETNIARAALDKFRQLEAQVRSTSSQQITTCLIRVAAAMCAEQHISSSLEGFQLHMEVAEGI